MPYLTPEVVAKAARLLFNTGNAYAIDFFILKADGLGPDTEVAVTSSNEPTPGLRAVAGQPPAFDELVVANLTRFPATGGGGYALPTRPQGNTPDDYEFYFPIVDSTRFLIRKREANRAVLWTHLEDKYDDYETVPVQLTRQSGQPGGVVTVTDDYVFKASHFYGSAGGRLHVPLGALAVWMNRLEVLPGPLPTEELIERTLTQLNITPEERTLLLPDDGFTVEVTDYVDDRTTEDYFESLCFGTLNLAPGPVLDTSLHALSRQDWAFTASTVGLRTASEPPVERAKRLILEGRRNILFDGPPRTGKSYSAEEIAADYLGVARADLDSDPRFTRVQFHHGWSYGDFIRRLVPKGSEQGIVFEDVAAPFLAHCRENTSASVFLIEEINRANVSEVFGEAFQVVEEGYRGREIRLAGRMPAEENSVLTVPSELLLLATANDVDRSTLPLDFAFLSRFASVYCGVRSDEIYRELATHGWGAELARRFVLTLRQVEQVAGYPIGHAFFYGFGMPDTLPLWYESVLRPVVRLYLTEYRADDLARVDALFEEWM